MNYFKNFDGKAVAIVVREAINDIASYSIDKDLRVTTDRCDVTEKLSAGLEFIASFSNVERFNNYNDRNYLRLAYEIVIESMDNKCNLLDIYLVEVFVKVMLEIDFN